MYCSKCGKEIAENSQFCSYCGAEVTLLNVKDRENEKEKIHSNAEQINDPKVICPYCGSEDIKHEKRMGCLGFIGEIFGTIIFFIIVLVINKPWITRGFYVLVVSGLVMSIGQLMLNKKKGKWTWDITCNSCKEKFVWDPTTHKAMNMLGENIVDESSNKVEKVLGYIFFVVYLGVLIAGFLWAKQAYDDRDLYEYKDENVINEDEVGNDTDGDEKLNAYYELANSLDLKKYRGQCEKLSTKYNDIIRNSDEYVDKDYKVHTSIDTLLSTTNYYVGFYDWNSIRIIDARKDKSYKIMGGDTIDFYGKYVGYIEEDSIMDGIDGKVETLVFVMYDCDSGNTDDATGYSDHDVETTTNDIVKQSFTDKETEGYQDILADIGENSEWCEYLYYDLDNDSIPEMIVGYGTCNADFQYEVYTTDSRGYISSVGGFPGIYMFYRAEDGNGLYAVYGHMGVEYVNQITLANGKVNCIELWNKEVPNDNYYSNNYPANAETYESIYGSNASNNDFYYIIPGSDTRVISKSELAGFDAEACRYARNEIYARHGRIFSDAALNNYFNSQAWYVGIYSADEFSDSLLSDVELKNLDIISSYEKENGFK